MKKVLIIDDNEMNRDLLTDILVDEYLIVTANDGKEGVEVLEANKDDLTVILLDLNMPVMDGYEVLAYMGDHGFIGSIPVLIISSEESSYVENRSFELGASDFIRRPFDMNVVKRRVKNVAEHYSYRNSLEDKIVDQNKTILDHANEIEKQNKLLKEQADTLRGYNDMIIDVLGTMVESRDLESGEHIKRVKDYTGLIARQMMEDYPEYGLTEDMIKVIVAASPLHDIGKIEIPDNILLKPGKLSFDEFELMKTHTLKGCELIKKIKGAWSEDYTRYSYEICRYHHERYDGKGYPDGLSGDDIPISAQCVSIADVYDALVNERCYKAAYSTDEAYEMIINGECGTFPPKIIEAFKKCKDKFAKIAHGNSAQLFAFNMFQL